MSATVTYKGAEIATLENETKTLETAGTWLEDDIVIEDITGGGSSAWTLLGSAEYTVSTTSTSTAITGTIQCGAAASTAAKIIYVKVRDKAGPRVGHFVGSDSFFININAANGSTTAFGGAGRIITRLATGGTFGQYQAGSTTGYGLFGYSISSSGNVQIRQRYNSTYSLTIDGTYVCEVWALEYPNGDNPFGE